MIKKLIIILFMSSILSFHLYATNGENHKILYVGKGGYSSIQDAINNASNGDTIYVSSGIYYENIFIGKTINLIGEHPLTTIIDGSKGFEPIKIDTVEVAANYVTISNFTIRNSLGSGAGIDVWDHYGHEKIKNCIISNNYYGIHFALSYNNYVSHCIFYKNEYGIWNKCCCGEKCSGSIFHRNNFTKNGIQAFDQGVNNWDGNYWDDYNGSDADGNGIGDTPYNISGGNNKDNSPYINPIDVIAPIVKVLFPNGGEILAGNITIRWTVLDDHDKNPKIIIEYSNDSGKKWYIIDRVSNVSKYNWNTTSLEKGENYLIRIIAMDKSGNKNSDTSDDTFTIISPPSIKIVRPIKGYFYFMNRRIMHLPINVTICIGRINVKVNASSEIGINKVEFFLDGNKVLTLNNPPYEWLWKKSFGKHEIMAKAYDNAGNYESMTISVWKFF